MISDIAYLGADHVLNVLGVADATGAPQPDASVQVSTIIDTATGEAVTGQAFPVLGVNTTGGDYTVALSAALSFVVGQNYQARGSITLSSGKVLPFRHNFTVEHFETPS